MNGAFEVGAVALRAQQRALDVLANNIANVNTPSFKRSDVRFSEIVADQSFEQPVSGLTLPGGLSSGGVRMTPRELLAIQGELRPTGNKLDMAIDGTGYIELMGPAGQTLLWRGGTLKVNEDGLLAADNGFALRAAITIPDGATNLQISPEGVVRADLGEEGTVELGQIALVKFDNEAALERLDLGLYRASEEMRLVDAKPGEDGTGLIIQGSIENSNVELTSEMVELLMVQRAYAASAQIVQAADQMAAVVNGLKR